jgi:hypothetical protein
MVSGASPYCKKEQGFLRQYKKIPPKTYSLDPGSRKMYPRSGSRR